MFKKKILSFALAVACLFGIAAPVSAASEVKTSGNVTINFKVEDVTTKKIVNLDGATFEAWRVAEAYPVEGVESIRYELVDEFKDTKIKLDGLKASEIRESAHNLAKVAKEPDATAKINSDGKGYFNKVKPGMYLIQQTKAEGTSAGYTKAEPFLISVPIFENGNWNYDVTIQPKSSVVKTKEEKKTPGEPKKEQPKKEQPKKEQPKKEQPKKNDQNGPFKPGDKGGNVKTDDPSQILTWVGIVVLGGLAAFAIYYGKKKK